MLMDFDKEVAITTCCNLSIEVKMFTRNSKFLTRNQMVPRDSITEEVSFEWSEDKISLTDSKFGTLLYDAGSKNLRSFHM